MPYLEIFANFREKVRNHAITLKANNILQECDRLRDDILPNVGVRLEDSNDTETCKVKLVNREELLKEKEAKKRLEAEKASEKEKRKLEATAAAAAKEAQRKIPPSEMFKLEKDKYSYFDNKVRIDLSFMMCVAYISYFIHIVYHIIFLIYFLCVSIGFTDSRY